MTKEEKILYLKGFAKITLSGALEYAGIKNQNFYTSGRVKEERLDMAIDYIKKKLEELEEVKGDVEKE